MHSDATEAVTEALVHRNGHFRQGVITLCGHLTLQVTGVITPCLLRVHEQNFCCSDEAAALDDLAEKYCGFFQYRPRIARATKLTTRLVSLYVLSRERFGTLVKFSLHNLNGGRFVGVEFVLEGKALDNFKNSERSN